jgi:hypothetical protein
VALGAAAALLVPALLVGLPALGWGLAGWLVAASVGVAGGAWTVARHGTGGGGFTAALAACILARLLLGAAGAFAAATSGMASAHAFLVGLAAAYVPVRVFEMVWFLQRNPGRV